MTDRDINKFDNLIDELKVEGETFKYYNLIKLNDKRYGESGMNIADHS